MYGVATRKQVHAGGDVSGPRRRGDQEVAAVRADRA